MIRQIVKFNVKPEYKEVFKAALIEDKRNAEQEAGCVEIRLFADANNPNQIFSYERWKNQGALDYHREHPYSVKICQLVDTALQSPVEALNLCKIKPAPDHCSAQPDLKDDVLIIICIFKIKEEYRERLLKQFEKHMERTRREDGRILFELYTVEGADKTLATHERWRNESGLGDIHLKQPYSVETAALMKEAIEGDVVDCMNFLREID